MFSKSRFLGHRINKALRLVFLCVRVLISPYGYRAYLNSTCVSMNGARFSGAIRLLLVKCYVNKMVELTLRAP